MKGLTLLNKFITLALLVARSCTLDVISLKILLMRQFEDVGLLGKLKLFKSKVKAIFFMF